MNISSFRAKEINGVVISIQHKRKRPLKRPFHQGLFWSREYSIRFLVDRPHFCENSREPASTVEHCPIPSGEDLARSPQYSEDRVPKKWSATVFQHVQKSARGRDDNRADQKNWLIGDNLVQIGPIGKKQSLVKWPLSQQLSLTPEL